MKKYAHYTDESFRNAEAFQAFLNAGHTLKYDYVIVGGILFTMHEYDMAGHYVTWANKKHNQLMTVETSNRYGATGYTDATVDIWAANGLREDIVYAE